MANEFIKLDVATGRFGKELAEVANRFLPGEALKIQKLAALQVLTGIVKKNPVGNPTKWKGGRASAPKGYVGGRSRANWQVQFQSTNSKEIDSTKDHAVETGSAEIQGINVPFDVIWIFNNVPYIIPLERGHSKQAPTGMVGLTLLEVQSGLGSL
jgi:hypothetical protein